MALRGKGAGKDQIGAVRDGVRVLSPRMPQRAAGFPKEFFVPADESSCFSQTLIQEFPEQEGHCDLPFGGQLHEGVVEGRGYSAFDDMDAVARVSASQFHV